MFSPLDQVVKIRIANRELTELLFQHIAIVPIVPGRLIVLKNLREID